MPKDRMRRFALLRAGEGSTEAGDLFEHFGVEVAVPAGPVAPLQTAASVLPCGACGWLRCTPLVEPCLVCAAPPAKAPAADEADSAPSPPSGGDNA